MASHTATFRMLRLAAFLVCVSFALAANCIMPPAAHAQDSKETVRVGWYESSFNTVDQFGRRSGYAYEYQQKLTAYTGWTYKYVGGSWSELMQMLADGDIDLMTDVSYKPEREESMLFSDLPMGTEEYYLFVAPGNSTIDSQDLTTLNGKKVGVNEGSIQLTFFQDWANKNGLQVELIEVDCTEDESLTMVEKGELDAYVTVDSFVNPDRAVPVWKIGSSDFYFVVSKQRPDLLSDLNYALNKIQDENRYYNQQMFEKHIKRSGANTFLASNEEEWLADHGTIRVGYQDNYLAFCAADKTTGELTGAMKDYLDYASDCITNTHIDFDAKAYPTSEAALEALTKGEVDCVFPANLGSYDGEKLGVVMTPSLMNTEVYAVIRQADQKTFGKKEHVVVAVNEGNPNYDAFLLDNYPEWRKVYFKNTEECLKAVADNVADCVLISNFRYNNISRLCSKYGLTTYPTGLGLDFCLAVSNGETELYSILSKAISMVPDSTVNAALSYYNSEDAKMTLSDFIAQNMPLIIAIIAIIILVILAFMIRSMRAEKKAKELISATETDVLTGLYNRNFFFHYANSIYKEHPGTPMDAIVLNIEQFHAVNALHGRDFGDQVLRTLGNEIKAIAKETDGIAGRFEADRFDIYCSHRDDYQIIFDRLQSKLDGLESNATIQLRMGVMPYRANMEPEQLFDCARIACSMARGHYKEHCIIFDDSVRKREIYEQRLLNDLRRGLDLYEFEVYYQPKFDIQCEPPKLVSAEALVRWRHPEFGMIPPGDFIALFERNGRIGEVDKYVWEEAARQVVRWREQYGVTIPVSVNLSRVDIFDQTLEKTLDDILDRNKIDHVSFKLEVTESAYTENAQQVIQVVESLRAKGYVVEMDDFGTGYSSLNMLSAMPVDVLKMDSIFIQNIDHNEKDVQLVALILNIAKSLNIPVVAEGVETEEQMMLLKDLGCEIVQGYYFSQPLQASDFEATYIRDREFE